MQGSHCKCKGPACAKKEEEEEDGCRRTWLVHKQTSSTSFHKNVFIEAEAKKKGVLVLLVVRRHFRILFIVCGIDASAYCCLLSSVFSRSSIV